MEVVCVLWPGLGARRMEYQYTMKSILGVVLSYASINTLQYLHVHSNLTFCKHLTSYTSFSAEVRKISDDLGLLLAGHADAKEVNEGKSLGDLQQTW